MNIREYAESGYDLYAEFAATVGRILHVALEQSETASRLQAMQRRAKNPQSLRKKLEMRGILDADDIEKRIKDLAGCRLIFYTNNDVNRLLSSHQIIDNFDVDWDKSKVHQPVDNSELAYVATHYVVSLKDERLRLPEYQRFRGLQCEIQVQSILNHAWAETSHDIVYKRPSLDGFGSKELESIEKRMQQIMTKYLMPAGYEFQKIEQDFQRLLAGHQLFEEGGLDKLESCDNNNERFETLERFRDFVLPQYDDVVAAFPNIRRRLVDVVQAARATETAAIETPFGDFSGKSYEQVTDVALDILERLRYVNVDEVFSAICEIYVGKRSDAESERVLRAVENLAEHNLEVWKQAGPYVQSRLCERIAALDHDELEILLPVAVTALSQVLNSEAESTSSTYSTITIHRAAVQPTAALAEVRSSAIALLEGMYSSKRTEQQRRMILSALWEATDIPRLGRPAEELDVMILNDSIRVVNFLTEISGEESFEVLQHLEHQTHWLFKRYFNWAQEDGDHAARGASSRDLIGAIEAFRDRVNENREFVIYKTLVGYESVFLPEWEYPDFDRRAKDEYRKERIAELLSSIEPQNADEWRRRIVRCARTESYDLATFPHFGQFLSDLARTKPDVAVGWLHDLDEKLERFLPSLLRGLEKSTAAESVRSIVDAWVTEGRYLPAITRTVRFSDKLDLGLLARIVAAAEKGDDVLSLIDVITVVFEKCTSDNFSDLGPIGLKSIRLCTTLGENRWIHEAWVRANESAFLELLDQDQARVILDNLQTVQRVDYHVESLLTKLADKHPALVLDFFGQRLRRDRDDEPDSKYEAIPFDLHELDQMLCGHADLVVGLSRQLFEEDDTLFEFRGGRLIRIVFAEFTEDLRQALIQQLKIGGDAGINFLLHIIRNYEGQPFLHELVKEIVCAMESDDKRLGLVEIALDSTGVVTGEFGMRDAYIRKKEEVLSWLTDDRERVRVFAERYVRTLDRQIAAEHRRAQEDIEMRKREYGEDDTDGES